MKKKIISVVLIIAMMLTAFGCGSSENSSKQTEKKSLKGTTIKVFYAYGGTDKIFDEFEKDTGIKVEGMDMSSGEVLSRIRAEKGKNVGDVWFGGGSDSFVAAKNDGLLEKYVSTEAENIKDEYKDKDGYWTGVSLVTVSFIVNKDVCAKKGVDIPETWEDLTKPQFKGEIMMSDPSISGTAYTVLSGLLQTMGKEKGWEFFQKLNQNIPYYSKRGSEPPQKAAIGEAMVGLAPGDGYDLAKQGYPVVTVFPKDGTPWWPAPVAIIKGAQNLDGAKVFVDWCLSEKGQNILKENDVRVPARNGIEIPERLKGIKDAKLMTIDFVVAGNERDSVVDEWSKNYKK